MLSPIFRWGAERREPRSSLITTGNVFWRSEPTTATTEAFRSRLAELSKQADAECPRSLTIAGRQHCNMSELCTTFSQFSGLGVNGLMVAAIRFEIQAGEADAAYVGAYSLSGIAHLLGAHVESWGGDEHARRQLLEILGITVGLYGGRGAAPLHATVWQGAITNYRRSLGANNTHYWEHTMRHYCGRLMAAADVFAHCIHGIGHGTLIHALSGATDPCLPLRGRDVKVGTAALRIASDMCAAAPSLSLGYLCATGLFHTYWILSSQPPEQYDWRPMCSSTRFAGPCFVFALMNPRYRDHAQCGHELPHAHATRGCVFGLSYSEFEAFDERQWKSFEPWSSSSGSVRAPLFQNESFLLGTSDDRTIRTSGQIPKLEPPRTLEAFCGNFVVNDRALNDSERRIYLSCIAGGAFRLKWRVEGYAVAPSVVDTFCSGNFLGSARPEYLHATPDLPSQAAALCRSIAMCGHVQGSPQGLLFPHEHVSVASLCEMGPGLWE